METKTIYETMDGNTACATIAYKVSEIAPIYPITPSSTMAELCDLWSSQNMPNIFGQIPKIIQLQSEGGAAGTLHGALRGGALATTFTASQGLLLMIPDMYKIAGELLPCVIHVSARALATHALSIFGDHSDVMATRSTGFALLSSTSVQEAHDFSLIAHSSAIDSSVPFLHFFDGFRTSHEVNEIQIINDDIINKMLNIQKINEFKMRALQNIDPKMYGTSQSADIYFQNRERANEYYNRLPQIVEEQFMKLKELCGREYHIFDYYGDKNAEFVVVCMGSGCAVLKEVCEQLNALGAKLGVMFVRLYRPFDIDYFVSKLPKSVRKIAVLDRTKESGAVGEPLFEDVCVAINQKKLNIDVIGGRYGLGSFEFNPTMAKAVFDNLQSNNPTNHFTVGINDDITHSSLKMDDNFEIINDNHKCVFFGIGGDGTISANKNSAKIIGNCSGLFSQAYFVYDSKKSGSMTVSHLRFGKEPINEPYQIDNADFLAVHNFSFINKIDVLQYLKQNGTVLLNCPFEINEIDKFLTKDFVDKLKQKNAKLYIIDALKIAKDLGLKNKINIIMQSAFFKLTNILDYNRAKQEMANYVIKSYSKFGQTIVDANIKAIEYGDKITELPIDNIVAKGINNKMNDINSEFYHNIMLPIEKLNGQNIPVSSFSVDGSIPVGTSQYEKRGIATDLPVWDRSKCIQCNLCSTVCPHASIRTKETTNPLNAEAVDTLTKNGNKFCLSVSPLDCTGCGNCVDICPARQKALSMQRSEDVLDSLLDNCEQFNKVEGIKVNDTNSIKNSQFKQPLLEFSGACAGCGQTAYVKLLTQLCGENLIIANATGCSSIWGGSYPSCPYTKTQDGLGVAWANSLFEDNAEFGLGIRLATELRRQKLMNVWAKISENNENLDKLYKKWLQNLDNFEVCKEIYFELLDALKHKNKCKNTKQLISLLDVVMPKNVWIIGGDGWAYDIGYGGLDHILASGQNVNILVLDTEIYSNTGGQASKSTPIGAVAKFAQSGKQTKKKDLAKMAMQYDDVYVARICIGANPNQALTAFKEAMENKGPSIIIAYAPCVSQGIDMSKTPTIEKMAVQSGYFTLLRRKPKITKSALEIAEENIKNNKQNENVEKNPTNVNETNTLDDYNKISGELIIDSGKPIISLEDFISIQNRFKIKK